MNGGIRTRKQNGEVDNESDQKLNGHANPRARSTSPTEPSENVFLFYPNIIGTAIKPMSYGDQS